MHNHIESNRVEYKQTLTDGLDKRGHYIDYFKKKNFSILKEFNTAKLSKLIKKEV